MNHIDFSNLGGLPFTQQRLEFMQASYMAAFSAMAQLAGNKTIIAGVVSAGGSVSDGWISYNGELIAFVGGSLDTDVVITDTGVPFTFGDATIHNVQFTKVATCGPVGTFPFADLVPLLSLKNVWKKDDLRQCVKDATYEAANFDASGYGLNDEVGWRIFSKVYTDAAGAVLVNKDPANAPFTLVGNHGGEKTHTLTPGEQGTFSFKSKNDDIGGGIATATAIININGTDIPIGAGNQAAYGSTITKSPNADATGHNNLQPYFVVLTLIKL